MSDFETLSDGDSVIVTYFNATSGKMREKSLKISEINPEFAELEETLGPSTYRYYPEDERLEMKRETDGDWIHLGNDCMVEKQ